MMNVHVPCPSSPRRSRQPKPDARRMVCGALYNPTTPMLRLMAYAAADRDAFLSALRLRFEAFDGKEVLVGWHLVDRGFFERSCELTRLLNSDKPLSRTMVEVILDFIGCAPEKLLPSP